MYMYSSICSFFLGQLMARPVYNSGPADLSRPDKHLADAIMAKADHN